MTSDPLQQLISNQARAEIFRILFDGRKDELHLREIVRRSGLALRTIQSEIKNLIELDLVRTKQDGNRLNIKANEQHPLYPDICSIVSKTSGYIGLLKASFAKLNIDTAFIFGSMVKETSKAHSDIDLIIVGKTGLRQLSPILRKISERVGREINPHVYTPQTWSEKFSRRDHFITSVMKEKKTFLIGDEHVLGKLG